MNSSRSVIVFWEMVTDDGGSRVSSGIDLNDGLYPFVIMFVATSSSKDSHCSLFFESIISNLSPPSWFPVVFSPSVKNTLGVTRIVWNLIKWIFGGVAPIPRIVRFVIGNF